MKDYSTWAAIIADLREFFEMSCKGATPTAEQFEVAGDALDKADALLAIYAPSGNYDGVAKSVDQTLDDVEATLDDPATKCADEERKGRTGGLLYGVMREVIKSKVPLTPPQITRSRELTVRMLVELFDMKEDDIDLDTGRGLFGQ